MDKLSSSQLNELLAYVSKDSFVYALAIEVKLARQVAPQLKAVLQQIDKRRCPSSFCSCDRGSAGEALEDKDLKLFFEYNHE